MRIVSIFLSWAMLAGCQQLNIHITQQGYSEQKLEQLVVATQKLKPNAVITITDLSVPADFPDSTIVLNPGAERQLFTDELGQQLTSLGFAFPQIFRFGEGRHFYSSNHIGIYVRNPDMPDRYQVPSYLGTERCQGVDGTMRLAKNGDVEIEYEITGGGNDEIYSLSGTWHYADSELALMFNDTVFSSIYTRERLVIDTYLGERPADIFTPTSTSNPISALNCVFLITYMDSATTDSVTD